MISPSNFVEERAPRLSAMGGRAGCNPDNPLELTTKCRLLAARGSKNAQFLAPRRLSAVVICRVPLVPHCQPNRAPTQTQLYPG